MSENSPLAPITPLEKLLSKLTFTLQSCTSLLRDVKQLVSNIEKKVDATHMVSQSNLTSSRLLSKDLDAIRQVQQNMQNVMQDVLRLLNDQRLTAEKTADSLDESRDDLDEARQSLKQLHDRITPPPFQLPTKAELEAEKAKLAREKAKDDSEPMKVFKALVVVGTAAKQHWAKITIVSASIATGASLDKIRLVCKALWGWFGG